jgi:hypothetical protein
MATEHKGVPVARRHGIEAMKHKRFCDKLGLENVEWCDIDWDEVSLRDVELDEVRFGMRRVWNMLPKSGWRETIHDARKFVALIIAGSGGYCPACGKWAKINPHALGGAHARALVWIIDAATKRRKWVNVKQDAPKWLTRTNQHQIMERWKLIERRSREGETKGYWRPTRRGLLFVLGRKTAAARVYTYSGKTVGFSKERVYCADIKSRIFNYNEQMRDTWMAELRRKN